MDTKELDKAIQKEFLSQQIHELRSIKTMANDILWYLKRIKNDTGNMEIGHIISIAQSIIRTGECIKTQEFAKRIPLSAFERFHRVKK